jgi:translocator protein
MDWATFGVFALASAAAGSTGVMFKPGDWYDGLKKPEWRPEKWMFPVAWTTIYLLSALAATWVAALPGSGWALALWSAQIALNTLWTPTFFGARRMGLGLGIMAVLWVVVALMVWAFFRLDLWAGLLLLPYLAWLSVAAPLNWRVWKDNPGAGA